MKLFTISCALSLLVCSAMARTVVVDPGGGGDFTTMPPAFLAIQASAEAANTINVVSTNGVVVASNEVWSLAASPAVAQDVTVQSADVGTPIIRFDDDGVGGVRYTVTLSQLASNTTTFDGIAFIPGAGYISTEQSQDAFQLLGGSVAFIDGIFSANDGSDGILSADAASADMTAGNNVGDDWFQANAGVNVTFSGCAISGSWDDAILVTGGINLTLDNGTVIANTGGAGIQVFGENTDVVCDGTLGRVLIADNGRRPGSSDTGFKTFGDFGSLTATETDFINASNGIVWDFDGNPNYDFTDVRIAFGNRGNATPSGNFNMIGANNNPATMEINLTRVTIHDCEATTQPQNGIYNPDAAGAGESWQVYTIVDSIFSGAGDLYSDMKNDTAPGGTSVVNISNSAAVDSGVHQLADRGDLGTAQIPNDPNYVSLAYTIGIAEDNPDFLLPQNPAYVGAASGSTDLVGGSPGALVAVPVELSIFSTN
jgi:hypothetical protein